MKKIFMALTLVAIAATKSFATDPLLVVSVPDPYITDTGTTLTLTITGDTAGIGMVYTWQNFDQDSSKWKVISGTDNNPELTVFQQSFTGSRAFRVNARNMYGHYWPSNTITLCHYGTNAVSMLEIETGGTGIDGGVVLQFQHTQYLRVTLQESADFQKTWRDIADVTDDSSYVGHEKIVGIKFYRLEALVSEGINKYSLKPFRVREHRENGVDYNKPLDWLRISNMEGTVFVAEEHVTIANPMETFQQRMLNLNLPAGIYQMECVQGNKRDVIRRLR